MRHIDQQVIYAVIRGEDSSTEAKAHIGTCHECRDIAKHIRSLQDAMRQSVEYSEEFTQSVLLRICHNDDEPKVRLWEVVRPWLVPAVQLVCAVSLLTLHESNQRNMDVGPILIAAVPVKSAAEDLAPKVSDLTQAFGIALAGR